MKLKQGFTLVELMVVVAIISILAAVAYPAYSEYVTRTKRSLAKSELNSIASRQETFFMDNKQYASDLTNLGMPANPYFIDVNGNRLAANASAEVVYQISAATPTTRSFTLTATPVNSQGNNDLECANLTLDNNQERGVSGTGTVSDCW
ncbi:MAG: type IV pilin protein [Gammaproteobacteria bacterium]|nr:type IV pilin protein [Gammaproteobacteria bacterium]